MATAQNRIADMERKAEIVRKDDSPSLRFTNMVMAEYNKSGKYTPTERERRLIQNYFICINQILQKSEADRQRKNAANSNHDYDNNLAYTWANIDLPQLAQDLAHYARVGLDMMQDNTLFAIPFKNSKDSKYTMTLITGYNGERYQAEKYALDPFRAVTVECIFSNDVFKPIKKDSRHPVEGYEFDIPSPFDRGELIGVFGYIEYDDAVKNKLLTFSKADVMKRKPQYASAEFWGGKKTVWKNGKKVEENFDGWLAEMYEKTMKRAIYGSKCIPRDPNKIDESYNYVRMQESRTDGGVAVETEFADVQPTETPAEPQEEIVSLPPVTENESAQMPPTEPQEDTGSNTDDEPDF